MDATQFMQQARQDEQISALLQDVASEATTQVEVDTPDSYMVTGVDILIAMAAYALFRLLKDYFDQKRALNEVAVLKEQQKIVTSLIEDGFKPKEAVAVTDALLDRIAKRGKDDPAMKAALKMFESGE